MGIFSCEKHIETQSQKKDFTETGSKPWRLVYHLVHHILPEVSMALKASIKWSDDGAGQFLRKDFLNSSKSIVLLPSCVENISYVIGNIGQYAKPFFMSNLLWEAQR